MRWNGNLTLILLAIRKARLFTRRPLEFDPSTKWKRLLIRENRSPNP